ncbi:MAG: ferrous iron transport protein B, partial [Anaerolineales bacterium]|nr:ferrous iron transport protein B [Anaerolineales bacterium]
MRLALVGQPNCGKSTLFNQVSGYKAETGNFSGTSVTYTSSKVRVLGDIVEVVDFPGTYTLSGSNPAEEVTLQYLASHDVDVIINVVDASQLSQGLGLTLELLELQRPTIIALNMMDEAARMGMTIAGSSLIAMLGTDVVPMVASKGRGVRNLFTTAYQLGNLKKVPVRPKYSLDIEEAIAEISNVLKPDLFPLNIEPLAIKLLEGDQRLTDMVMVENEGTTQIVQQLQGDIEQNRGQSAYWVISGERHGLASKIASQVVEQGERRISWRDRLDDVLLHPVWGYITLLLIFLLFFELIFGIGSAVEVPLLTLFEMLINSSEYLSTDTSLIAQIIVGTIQGIAGGVAIVLPYLIPFLVVLGIMEDVGYLPRVAFLMDSLMNRIGLHGKAIVPFILGYGCNVPAVMSTRMLENKRDRFLAATLATLVPCAARLAVVFGLVAFYLGPRLALLIYIFNLFVIAV